MNILMTDSWKGQQTEHNTVNEKEDHAYLGEKAGKRTKTTQAAGHAISNRVLGEDLWKLAYEERQEGCEEAI